MAQPGGQGYKTAELSAGIKQVLSRSTRNYRVHRKRYQQVINRLSTYKELCNLLTYSQLGNFVHNLSTGYQQHANTNFSVYHRVAAYMSVGKILSQLIKRLL